MCVPSPSSSIKKHKRTHGPTSDTTNSQQVGPVIEDSIDKTDVLPVVEISYIETQKQVQSNAEILPVDETSNTDSQKEVQNNVEILYCNCRQSYDEISSMIACDRPNCPVEWYHFDCLGVTFAPEGNWYCPDCQ